MQELNTKKGFFTYAYLRNLCMSSRDREIDSYLHDLVSDLFYSFVSELQ